MGAIERAIDETRRALAENPEDVRALLRLGDLLTRTGRIHEAAGPYWRAADLYERDGFFLKAVAVCRQILRMDPGQREAVRAAMLRLSVTLGLPVETLMPEVNGRGR